jgi:hypothetical protein
MKKLTRNKAGKRERETERDLGRVGEQHSSEIKQRGLILTVGLNQQHLRISMTPENFLRVSINKNNRRITANQYLGWHSTFLA